MRHISIDFSYSQVFLEEIGQRIGLNLASAVMGFSPEISVAFSVRIVIERKEIKVDLS